MSNTRRPLPPPLVVPAPGLWRDTPPALFPPILGLLGLGLALRTLGAAPGAGPVADLAEALLGAVVLLHAFAMVAYLAKPLRRPQALIEEVATLPGRAGVAAALAGVHLSAAALMPLTPRFALAMVLAGLVLQAGFMWLVVWRLRRLPPEARAVNPVFHLTFLGHILSLFVLVPLGWSSAAAAVFWIGLASACAIWLASLPRAAATPAPLRPILAIHLAPASVLSSGAVLLGWEGIALALLAWAGVLALLLVLRLPWLMAAGFSPIWGALTFPLAAFGQAVLRGPDAWGFWLGAGLAAVGAAFIPWVAWRVLRQWPGGALARRTNAAVA